LERTELIVLFFFFVDDVGAEDPNAADKADEASHGEKDDMEEDEEDTELAGDDKSNVTSMTNNSDSGTTTTLDARARLASRLLLLNGPDLGHIISWLEKSCPEALQHNPGIPDVMEINVDVIDAGLLTQLTQFAAEKSTTRQKHGIDPNAAIDDITGKRKRKR
jgi:hypothetical protein